ncbi:MAG TPA: glycosyltransferase family 9 protein [Acidobacteriota bacterium]|nr:glycosyltransferase family 9 protein [Acidobacteriota bacterium]
MKDSPKILIVRLSSLGDILHTLPAFASLRESFPGARIDWLAAPKSHSLLSAVPGISVLHTIDTAGMLRLKSVRSSWNLAVRLITELRLQKYDIAIDFQGLMKTALLCALSGSARRLGFGGSLVRERPADFFYHQTLEKPERPVHVTVLNRMLAELAGARAAARHHDFSVSDDDVGAVNTMLAREQITDFIILNPGGGWPTKRWHLQRFGALAKTIREKMGLPVVVTTGPGEESYYRTIHENSGGAAVHHFPVSFLQMIPLLKKALLLVGGDTGPFHLACALETPVVGIFGPTSSVRNGLWNSVGEVVTLNYHCSPCHRRSCPSAIECMDIPVDTVMNAVVGVASGGRKETY